ncbi:MAG: hypothetical protein ACRC5C_04905 [Bacilli bacterium]
MLDLVRTRKDLVAPNEPVFAIMTFCEAGLPREPFQIREHVLVETVLGDTGIAHSVSQLRELGINPFIYRLNGVQGDIAISLKEDIEHLRLVTLDASIDVKEMFVRLLPTHLFISGARKAFTYYFADFDTLGELVAQMEFDRNYNGLEVTPFLIADMDMKEVAVPYEKEMWFSNMSIEKWLVPIEGYLDDEVRIENQIQRLMEEIPVDDLSGDSFGELDKFNTKVILFNDIPFEYMPIELIDGLSTFTKGKVLNQEGSCVFITRSAILDNGNRDFNILIDKRKELEKKMLQDYAFMNCVIGNSMTNNDLLIPLSIYHGALVYKEETGISTTNKPVDFISIPEDEQLKKVEVVQLISNGYIPFVVSIKYGFVSASNRTIYPSATSPLRKLHSIQTVIEDMKTIQETLNDYIGEMLSEQTLESMAEDINDILTDIKESERYRDIMYEFISATNTSYSFRIIFDLYGEIESVSTSFEYKPSKGVAIS